MQLVSIVVVMSYVAVAVPLATALGKRLAAPVLRWLADGGEPSAEVCDQALALPWLLSSLIFTFWLGSAVIFAVLNLFVLHPSAVYIARSTMGTVLGGLTTCAVGYLLTERALRPVFARTLAGQLPKRTRTIGIRPRLLLSWLLGSGVPLLALGTAPLGLSANRQAALTAPILFLAALGMISGFLLMVVAARSFSDPLDAVQAGLRRVQEGDMAVELSVDDGGEVGRLQAGFNHMVAGLRERQRLQDLFGRHVGVEVARQALERGVRLGGEVRPASVLFVDLVGSTALAVRHSPEDVVAILNDFFAAVVRTTSAQGGWVNKFEGDAALCIFGPPANQPGHPAQALRAARALRSALEELARIHPGLEAGTGVSSGTVVAGNVGAEDRYEYTVVGDPVNEAARLAEMAKTRPEGVLASGAAVTGAGDEGSWWVPADRVTLRGRAEPTETFVPKPEGGLR
jgi:adenylate cyclase